MAQAFLEARQYALLVLHLGIDHPIGMEAGLGDRRRKQVAAGYTPQDLACGARHDAGGKQCRGGAVDSTVAATGDLVQGTESEAPTRYTLINGVDTERQRAMRHAVGRFDRANPIANGVKGEG